MTRLVNNPDNFPSQAVAGLVSAFPNHLRPVFGGVVRAARTDRKVALVVGGGSGHYPAFAGWVGPRPDTVRPVGFAGSLSVSYKLQAVIADIFHHRAQ